MRIRRLLALLLSAVMISGPMTGLTGANGPIDDGTGWEIELPDNLVPDNGTGWEIEGPGEDIAQDPDPDAEKTGFDYSSFTPNQLNVFEFDELERTFEELVKDEVLEDKYDYVLNAIEYHIQDPNKDSVSEGQTNYYIVARNLLRLDSKGNPYKDPDVTGNVLFFFEGCSSNLSKKKEIHKGGGFTIDDEDGEEKRTNNSALCVLVQLNESNKPVVAFATRYSSTTPDNVRRDEGNKDDSGKSQPVPTLKDGIYTIKTRNHQDKYAALKVYDLSGGNAKVVRFSHYVQTNEDESGAINIHARHNTYLTDISGSSVGCLNIGFSGSGFGTTNDDPNVYKTYNDLIYNITGVDGARTNGD